MADPTGNADYVPVDKDREGATEVALPTGPHVYLETDPGDGHTRMFFVHECTWGGGKRVRDTELPLADDGWKLAQDASGELTVTPSIHCTACGLHGFYTAGEWR